MFFTFDFFSEKCIFEISGAEELHNKLIIGLLLIKITL